MFTVVTITYNAESCVKKTIESIASQVYTGFEYLIIDGQSSDKTLYIAEKYQKDFNTKKISYKIISESDKGIFDAMNKGISNACGEWIIFMNAGDMFYSDEVFGDIKKWISSNVSDDDMILYGDTVVESNGFYQKRKPGEIDKLVWMQPFYHQSVFVRTELMKNTMFDTQYRIAGDYDLFLKFYLKKLKFCYIPITVSIFGLDGVSETNHKERRTEHLKVRINNGVCTEKNGETFFNKTKTTIFIWMREVARKMFSGWYYSEKRGWYKNKWCGSK